MINELDEKKIIGPDGVSGYILKECRHEIKELSQFIIQLSVLSEQKKS